MSLYVGNLSEHTRRDELERVFRRFGHCNLKLKREGYGFVVFDFPPNAEKALRALKGGNICGEPLTLTWSNKQPRNFRRFARGGRELQHARNSDRLGYARRKGDFNGWRNYKMGNVGRDKSVDMPSEERGFHQDDFRDYVGLEKNFPNGGGVIPNLDDNGRWGEPIHDPSVDSGNENAIEFDRYEPYRGYDRKHENENHHIGESGCSPAAKPQENVARAQIGDETSNHSNDSKYQLTCYRCGDSGHKMRNCPKGRSLQRKYKRLDTLPIRNQRNKGRVSGSRGYYMSLRNESSTVAKETDRHCRKEYGGKKRSRNEIESPKRSRVKISRGSISSSLPSDYSASHPLSNAELSKYLSRPSFRSRSRSVSSRAHSSSSQLRSSSKSQHCRGRSLNSRKSSSPTSLSGSLGQPLPSSPNQIQLNSKTSYINATAIESADHLVAQGQQIDSAMELDNGQSKYAGIVVNGSAAVHTPVVDAMEKDHYVQEDNTVNHIVLSPSDGVTITGNLSPRIVKETEAFWHSGTLMMDDIPTEIQKPASETHANPHSGLSTIITPAEMCVVLKNYGLELPKDDEKNLRMDSFFGCARLWPWHIIYYRRLKKGLISTENYARRVAQNQEFGIVDKYIRSSSGWGELSLQNS